MGLSFNGVSRQLHRITVTKTGAAARNGLSTLLGELKQRIRDVRQGPDGLLYLTTDEATGAVLKVEPVAPDAASK
jgi:glucose/arabinose dehydrogenase